MIRLTTTRTMTARPDRPAPAASPQGSASDNGRRMGGRRAFTLVELLVVIVILALLIALLLPAINAALRTARNAAVTAEINQMAQALADFKSKYGDYPPSRIYLAENGDYSVVGSNSHVPSIKGDSDITVGQLASRSLTALRKFWPRVQLSTQGPVFPANTTAWYDFNGNGNMDAPYILQGHECLVFFLGGIPSPNPVTSADPASVQFGVSGFGKDPTNPFSNNIVGNLMYNANRQSPFFQFNAGRLFLDPNNPTFSTASGFLLPGIPGYYDSLNNGPPGTGTIGFFAYFCAYGNGNYDPNDVNFQEMNSNASGPIALEYFVNFPTYGGTAVAGQGHAYLAISPSPNPYTSTPTAYPPNQSSTTSGTVTYQNAQTFQIISPGADGLYGVGGQFDSGSQQSSASVALPFDPVFTYDLGTGKVETDLSIRKYESDNLTNIKSGTLQ